MRNVRRASRPAPLPRRRVAAVVVAAAVLGPATPVGAHGVAGPRNLPMPLWQFLYAAGFAVVIALLVLRVAWPVPRLARAASGRPLGRAVDVVATVAAGALRALGLVVFVVVLSAAWVGDTNPRNNVAPVLVQVGLWAIVPLASVVLGNVWAALSPFDTLAALAERTRRRPPVAAPVTHWPAAVGAFGLVWLLHAYHAPSSPRVLAWVISGYSIVVAVQVARHGRRWLRDGETFAVIFGLFAALAPLQRDERGRVRVRPPLAGLAEVRVRPGTLAVVATLIGAVAFDGMSRMVWWADAQDAATSSGWDRTMLATVGLAWCVAAVGTLLTLVTWRDRGGLGAFVPLLAGFTLAHSFLLVLVEGQALVALASNPYGRNWNLFDTATNVVDPEPIGRTAVLWVVAGALAGAHVAAAVAAHDRAVSRAPAAATRAPLPTAAALVVLLCAGLYLLLGT